MAVNKTLIIVIVILVALAAIFGGLYYYKTDKCLKLDNGRYVKGATNMYGSVFIPSNAMEYSNDLCSKPFVTTEVVK